MNPETKFIWTFIAPVAVIIAVNILLFVVVLSIMWKHQKKMVNESTTKNVKYVFCVIVDPLVTFSSPLLLS